MPAAFGFQSGSRCGLGETFWIPWRRSQRYACSMSLTTIATCWNQRSLLRASASAGRPRDARYSVSSRRSSPSRSVTIRARAPKIPCRRRSEEHTSELQSRLHLVCRLLLEKKKTKRLSPAEVEQVQAGSGEQLDEEMC